MTVRSIALVLLWAGILAGCSETTRSHQIILLTDLTGPQAASGEGIRLAAGMALEDMSSALIQAGWRIDLTAVDAPDSAAALSAAVSRIAARSDTLCAVLHTSTAGNLAAAEVLHAAGIPAVLPAETASFPKAAPMPELLWLAPEAGRHGAADAEWAAAQGFTTVYLLADPEGRSRAVGDGFRLRALQLGLDISEYELSPDRRTSPWIPPLRSAPPQLVYSAGDLDYAPVLLADLEAAEYNGALFLAAPAAQGLPSPGIHSNRIALYYSPAAQGIEADGPTGFFAEDFRNRHGVEPPPLAALVYDSVTLCLLPLMQGSAADIRRPPPRAEILSYWRSGAEWKGVAGEYLLAGGRPNRVPVLIPSKELPGRWIPAS
ncbi:MAG: ABC transporter substrate-binding protein [Anaerolineales bacterium]|nr:ABC transporter substrate-binding protein [Anaerolineales bacterium]